MAFRGGPELERFSTDHRDAESEPGFELGSAPDGRVPTVTFLGVRDNPPVEPMTDAEMRSIAFADADGWRCFYPATRGHLTAAQARAVMRAERGMPEETAEEAEAAEFLLTVESGWNGNDSD